MRCVVQRVKYASVAIDGNIVGKIDKGFMILIGLTHTDTPADVSWMVKKIVSLRVFEDPDGKMNLGLQEVNGQILAISQFTLYADCIKGRRPSFIDAARPEVAIPLYEQFIAECRAEGVTTEHGEFGADMKVELLNDGPVTIIIDTADVKNLKK